MQSNSPLEVVDRQLQAYNARDIDAYCALFADDAVVVRVGNPDREVARGIAAIREFYTARFRSTGLSCRIKARMSLGDFVIDHEVVTGIRPEVVQVIAIYEVRESLIRAIRIIWPE